MGFVEATGRDLTEKNRLCPPNPLPNVPVDFVRGALVEHGANHAWSKEPDVAAWLARSRLDVARGLGERSDRPDVRAARLRFAGSVRPALAGLARLVSRETTAA